MKNAWMILGLIAGLQATAAEPARPSQGIAPPKRLPDPEVVAPMKTTVGDPVTAAALPLDLRRLVVADAAKYFRVSENAVVLTHAEQVTWSDGSLGCARPGVSYTQALVPGFRIVARTAEHESVYHTDSGARAVRCEEALPVRGSAPRDGAPGNDAQPRTGPPKPVAPDR